MRYEPGTPEVEEHGRQLLQYCNRIFKTAYAWDPYRSMMEGAAVYHGGDFATRRGLRDVVLAVASSGATGDLVRYSFGYPDRTLSLSRYLLGDMEAHPFGGADDWAVDRAFCTLVDLLERREVFMGRNAPAIRRPEMLMCIYEDHLMDLAGSLRCSGVEFSEGLNGKLLSTLRRIRHMTYDYVMERR